MKPVAITILVGSWAFLLAADGAGRAQSTPSITQTSVRAAQAPLGSYLFKLTANSGDKIEFHGEAFVPRPGDLFLFDDGHVLQTALYWLAGTSGPLHASIAFRKPDGAMSLLEAGPNLEPRVLFLDVVPRLHGYNGMIMVRRLKVPLTAEQDEKLTQFALAQEGKPYAWGRILSQGTPFRPRGPIRKMLLGRTCLDRSRWTCYELTAAAATAAGVLDPNVHFANAMYPRDFAYDEVFDLSPFYHEPALWYPHAELKRVGDGIQIGFPGGRRPLPK